MLMLLAKIFWIFSNIFLRNMARTLSRKMVYWETKLSLPLFKPQDWEIAKQFSLPRSMELTIVAHLLALVFLEEPLMDIDLIVLPVEVVAEEEAGAQTLAVPCQMMQVVRQPSLQVISLPVSSPCPA